MIIKKYLILIFVSIFGFSCKNTSEEIPLIPTKNEHKEISFELFDSLLFHFPDSLSYRFTCIEAFEDNNDVYIGLFAKESRQFTLLAYNQQKIEYSIRFKKDGPNNLPSSVSQFDIKNKDTLLMINEYLPALFLFDKKGKRIEKKKITGKLPNNMGEYSMPGTSANIPFISGNLDTCIFFTYWQYGDFNKMYHSSFLVDYIFSEQKFHSFFGEFPQNYKSVAQNGQFYPWCEEPSLERYGKNMAVSLQASDYILIFDPDSVTNVHKVDAKSKYADKIEPISVDKQNFSEMTKFYTSNTLYMNLIYDKYHKKYYRIVKHKMDLKNSRGRLNNWMQAKWSILVFDSNFNIIGEQDFDAEKYNFSYIFPTSKGLLISCNNKYNNQLNEGDIEFKRFNLVVK